MEIDYKLESSKFWCSYLFKLYAYNSFVISLGTWLSSKFCSHCDLLSKRNWEIGVAINYVMELNYILLKPRFQINIWNQKKYQGLIENE